MAATAFAAVSASISASQLSCVYMVSSRASAPAISSFNAVLSALGIETVSVAITLAPEACVSVGDVTMPIRIVPDLVTVKVLPSSPRDASPVPPATMLYLGEPAPSPSINSPFTVDRSVTAVFTSAAPAVLITAIFSSCAAEPFTAFTAADKPCPPTVTSTLESCSKS